MRIAEFLRMGFAGALLFTPAMADEVAQVHEEALRVLRETLGQAPTMGEAQAVRGAGLTESSGIRLERDARIRAEAQGRIAEREQAQAERQRQFKQFVQDRQRLREQQREYYAQVVGQTAQTHSANNSETHTRALEVLRQVQSQQLGSPASAPVNEAEVAPRTVAQASALGASTELDSAEIHSRALEILRQQTQTSSSFQSPGVGAESASTATPSPELQQRLREMQAELEQEQFQRRGGAASPGISQDYVADLERRALEAARANPSAAAGSGLTLDPATRSIIERQDRELSSGLGTTALRPVTPAPSGSATPAFSGQTVVTAAPSGSIEPVPGVTHSRASDNGMIQYSRELEERARQLLLERAQTQSPVAPSPANGFPASVPARPASVESITPAPQAPAAAAPTAPAPAAVTAPANIGEVHQRALEALNQVQSSDASRPAANRGKMQRLRELTDLYRADRIGPAEYHRKRAEILAEPQ